MKVGDLVKLRKEAVPTMLYTSKAGVVLHVYEPTPINPLCIVTVQFDTEREEYPHNWIKVISEGEDRK